MTTRTRRKSAPEPERRARSLLLRYFPAWVLLAVAVTILMPQILRFTLHTTSAFISSLTDKLFARPAIIAPLFTAPVTYWAHDIERWAAAYDLDPNLLATVMQIESCGHPSVSSYAGAQGLFQVMPFHFESGENQIDPDTNAKRGASFLHSCLGWANGDTGLAMACYNGGPSVLGKHYSHWNSQTQRYYYWGKGIYADALHNRSHSPVLQEWLAAGGKHLCDKAHGTLGLG